MGAIVGHYGLEESVTRALEAGNDLLLLCHRPELIRDAAKALAQVSPTRLGRAENRDQPSPGKTRSAACLHAGGAWPARQKKSSSCASTPSARKPPPIALSMTASARRWKRSSVTYRPAISARVLRVLPLQVEVRLTIALLVQVMAQLRRTKRAERPRSAHRAVRNAPSNRADSAPSGAGRHPGILPCARFSGASSARSP